MNLKYFREKGRAKPLYYTYNVRNESFFEKLFNMKTTRYCAL